MKVGMYLEKSKNLELVGASPIEWQVITPRGGPCRPPPLPPHIIGLNAQLAQTAKNCKSLLRFLLSNNRRYNGRTNLNTETRHEL